MSNFSYAVILFINSWNSYYNILFLTKYLKFIKLPQSLETCTWLLLVSTQIELLGPQTSLIKQWILKHETLKHNTSCSLHSISSMLLFLMILIYSQIFSAIWLTPNRITWPSDQLYQTLNSQTWAHSTNCSFSWFWFILKYTQLFG